MHVRVRVHVCLCMCVCDFQAISLSRIILAERIDRQRTNHLLVGASHIFDTQEEKHTCTHVRTLTHAIVCLHLINASHCTWTGGQRVAPFSI